MIIVKKLITMTDIFTSVIGRIKTFSKARSESEIAKLLNLNQSTFAERKRRGSLPFEEIITYADKSGVSLDWIFLGEGNPERRAEGGSQSLNASLLQDIVEGIEEYLEGEKLELSGDKKAELTVYLYERLLKEQTEKSKVRGEVKALLKLVA